MNDTASLDASGETTPHRPAQVPRAAIWSAADYEWQWKPTDGNGLLHGQARTWRADGSARTVSSYSHGKQVGAAWSLHRDGSLFSLGCFTDGLARGVHRRYASDDPEGEPLQSCCVPPGAWQLRQDYSQPNTVDQGWFRRDGQRLLESGNVYPERPAGVWPDASYIEQAAVWEAGLTYQEKGYQGTRRQWSREGVLRLVEDVRDNKRHGEVRSYDSTGALAWEAHYIAGRLSGAFRAPDVAGGHFSESTIRAQFGFFEADQARDAWRYLDADGALVVERDMGLVLDEQTLALSPALANERRPASWWRALAEGLRGERRIGEALVAAARAAARANDPLDLVQAMSDWALPLGPEAAGIEADQTLERGAETPLALIDGLKRGCNASTMLWALAKALPDKDRTALDLVTAALLLPPISAGALATRTLLHAALGDLNAARADAARVAEISVDQGDFLSLCLRTYFPRFSFWPMDEQLEVDGEAFPIANQRIVSEVRDVIQRYATRLAQLRAALMSRLAEERDGLTPDQAAANGELDLAPASFMIPDLTFLLPDGPVQLSRRAFQMSLQDYQDSDAADASDDLTGGEVDPGGIATETAQPAPTPNAHAEDPPEAPGTVEITIDETHHIAPAPSAVLAILRCARADWSGLTWLCWAAGLKTVGLPDEILPPPSFGHAAVMTMERTWRCRDKIRTSGLLAMTKGIPGFDWEGTAIDLLPGALVDVPLDEYIEARAVFSWLCDRANQSPWQDDLRGNDD